MHCDPCLKVGVHRDGFPDGLCWSCKKKKCAICGHRSAGCELCVDCGHKVELRRLDALANMRILNDGQRAYRAAMGEAGLAQARTQLYAAIDSSFRILGQIAQRLEGHIEECERARTFKPESHQAA